MSCKVDIDLYGRDAIELKEALSYLTENKEKLNGALSTILGYNNSNPLYMDSNGNPSALYRELIDIEYANNGIRPKVKYNVSKEYFDSVENLKKTKDIVNTSNNLYTLKEHDILELINPLGKTLLIEVVKNDNFDSEVYSEDSTAITFKVYANDLNIKKAALKNKAVIFEKNFKKKVQWRDDEGNTIKEPSVDDIVSYTGNQIVKKNPLTVEHTNMYERYEEITDKNLKIKSTESTPLEVENAKAAVVKRPSNDVNTKLEGVTHINIAGSSNTKLGKDLNVTSPKPFKIGDVVFSTIKGFWNYSILLNHRKLKDKYGKITDADLKTVKDNITWGVKSKAKAVFTRYDIDKNNTVFHPSKEELKTAYRQIIERHGLKSDIISNTLPLSMYFLNKETKKQGNFRNEMRIAEALTEVINEYKEQYASSKVEVEDGPILKPKMVTFELSSTHEMPYISKTEAETLISTENSSFLKKYKIKIFENSISYNGLNYTIVDFIRRFLAGDFPSLKNMVDDYHNESATDLDEMEGEAIFHISFADSMNSIAYEKFKFMQRKGYISKKTDKHGNYYVKKKRVEIATSDLFSHLGKKFGHYILDASNRRIVEAIIKDNNISAYSVKTTLSEKADRITLTRDEYLSLENSLKGDPLVTIKKMVKLMNSRIKSKGSPIIVEYISARQAEMILENSGNKTNIVLGKHKAFRLNGVIYFIKGYASYDSAIHEFIHPFVDTLEKDNNELFRKLIDEVIASETGQKLIRNIEKNYRIYNGDISLMKRELLTHALTEVAMDNIDKQSGDVKETKSILGQFWEWLITGLFGPETYRKIKNNLALNVADFGSDMTIRELGSLIMQYEGGIEVDNNVDGSGIAVFDIDVDDDSDLFNDPLSKGNHKKKLRIKRMEDSIEMLEKVIKTNLSVEQLKIVNKLIGNVEKHKEAINNNEYINSATKAMGDSMFMDAADYQIFAKVGTMLHYVLEGYQKKTIGNPSKFGFFTKEDFNDIYEDYINDTREDDAFYFDEDTIAEGMRTSTSYISGLNRDVAFRMISKTIMDIAPAIHRGAVLIPEVPVIGVDKEGKNLSARIDMMLLAKDGTTQIIDLKIKRIPTNKFDEKGIHNYLSRTFSYSATPDSLSELVGPRSTYDNWNTQLAIQQSLLSQSDIRVNDSERHIMPVFYHGDSYYTTTGDKKEIVRDFTFVDFAISAHISDYSSFSENSEQIRFRKIQKGVREAVPYAFSEKEKAAKKVVIAGLDEDTYNNIKGKLLDKVESELANINKTIELQQRNVSSDKRSIEALKDRKATLIKIKDTINSESTSWTTSHKIMYILEMIGLNINKFSESLENTEGLTKSELANVLTKSVAMANTFNLFLQEVHGILVAGGVKENEEVYNLINNIQGQIVNIGTRYRKYGESNLMELYRAFLPEGSVEKITAQAKGVYTDKINALTKKIDRLKTDGKVGLFQNVRKKVNKYIFDKELTTDNIIDELEVKKAMFEAKREGIDLSEDGIRNMLNGIYDKNSPMYVGKGVTALGNYMASASNPDLTISSFTNFLKQVTTTAQRKMNNFLQENNINETFSKAMEGKEGDSISRNKAWSEITSRREYNPATESYENVDTLGFVNPLSEEYKKKHDILKAEVDRTAKEYNTVRRKPSVTKEEKDEVTKLKNLKSEAWRAFSDFLVENTITKYKPDYYKVFNSLPPRLADELHGYYEEMEMIKISHGYNNEELLTEDDIERVHDLQQKINNMYSLLDTNGKLKSGQDKKDAELMISRRKSNADIFTYTPNYQYFETIREKKRIQYKDDPGEFDKWLEANERRVPNEDYFNAIGELYEQIYHIVGEDKATLKIFKDVKNDLIRKYKIDGIPDFSRMSEEELQQLHDYDVHIQSLKKDRKGKKTLSAVERDERDRLFSEINALQEKVINPNYQQQYDSKYGEVLQKHKRLLEIEIEYNKDSTSHTLDEVEAAKEEFIALETEFSDWYNRMHEDKYSSLLVTPERRDPPKIRGFNYLYRPIQDVHYDVKPSFKYNVRTVNEEFVNPDYNTTIDGYPIPKGMSFKGNVLQVDEMSKWVNPAYITLRNSKTDFEFYSHFLEMYFSRQGKIVGQKLGYYFPGYAAKSVEQIQKDGLVKGVQNMNNRFVTETFKTDDLYDYSVNDIGNKNIDRVRLKFNRPLPIEDQSPDGVACVLKWFEESFINESMAEIQPLSISMIDFFKKMRSDLDLSSLPDKQKRSDELGNLIGIMEFEYDKFIKGEYKKDEGLTGRIGDAILSGVGYTKLAFWFPGHIGNFFSGNVQSFLAAERSSAYNLKNIITAKKQVYDLNDGLLANSIRDFGKLSDKSFIVKMYERWNPLQESWGDTLDKTRSAGQMLLQGFTSMNMDFFIQDKGEFEIASTIWLAILDNKRVKIKGKDEWITLYNAYVENENGVLELRDDIELKEGVTFTEQHEEAVQRLVWSVYRTTQGNYAKYDQTKAESSVFFRYIFFYRKYLLPYVLRRFGSLRMNWEAEELTAGFYRVAISAFNHHGFKESVMSLINPEKSEIDPFYRRGLMLTFRETAVAGASMLIGNMLKGLAADLDDDDPFKKWLALNMMAVYLKVERETRAPSPMPLVGGMDDYIQMVGSVSITQSTLVSVGKLLTHAIALSLAQVSDSEGIHKLAYYQQGTDYYDKGTARVMKDLDTISGFFNIMRLNNPGEYIDGLFARRQ